MLQTKLGRFVWWSLAPSSEFWAISFSVFGTLQWSFPPAPAGGGMGGQGRVIVEQRERQPRSVPDYKVSKHNIYIHWAPVFD